MASAISFLSVLIKNYWKNIWRGNKKSSYILYILLVPFLIYRYLLFIKSLRQSLAAEDFTFLGILLLINLAVWILPVWKSQYITQQVKEHLYFPLKPSHIYGINFVSVFLFPSSIFALSAFLTAFYYLPYNSLFIKQLILIVIFHLICIQIFLLLLNLLKRKIIRNILAAALVIIAAALALRSSGIRTGFDLGSLTYRAFSVFILPANESFTLKLISTLGILVVCSIVSYFSLKDSLYAGNNQKSLRSISPFYLSKLPIQFGELIKNYLIHYSRFWHVYVGFAISIYYSIFLIQQTESNYAAINFVIIGISVINADLIFNVFGYETQSSIDRYLISPIKPKTLITAKLTGFVLVLFLQFIIPILTTMLGISFIDGAVFALKIVIISLPYMILGTYFSIKFPFPTRYLKMPPDHALLFYALGLFFGSIYLLIGDILDIEGFSGRFIFNICLFILGVSILLLLLPKFSDYLDKNLEKIKNSVS